MQNHSSEAVKATGGGPKPNKHKLFMKLTGKKELNSSDNASKSQPVHPKKEVDKACSACRNELMHGKHLANTGSNSRAYEESIHAIILKNHVECARSSLQYTSDCECIDSKGRTLLHTACHSGNIEIAKHLIEYHANVDALTKENLTPLIIACSKGNVDIVKSLLKNNAKADIAAESHHTAVSLAAKSGSNACLRALLSYGASVETHSSVNPMHLAAENGFHKCIITLFKYGCSLNAMDRNGYTPLKKAVKNGELQAVNTLLTLGAERDTESRQSELHLSCRKGHTDVLQSLINADYDACGTFEDNWTPLHEACMFQQTEIVQALISYGVDVNVKDVKGVTPLILGKRNGDRPSVRCLLKADVIIDLPD